MKMARWLCAGLVLILFNQKTFAQQLKLGKNPYTVEKSAVLELVSDNQGLLLPRITDTSLINTLNPPDGMIIYYVPDKQLLIRSNSVWKGLTMSGFVVTSLNGNTGALTMDTSYISNFYLKARSVLSASSPITYNSSTGLIGITQAGSSSNGYLSSADWNTFNNKQSSGNYITDPGGNGILARTALNTTINRTITGTSNRISIANGDGASGNPTIDISSLYAGQNTITTLGTISTGAWNGTKISETYGGTNQSTYTTGDILYASAANTLSKLAGSTSLLKKFLSQTGDGTNSAAPSWSTLSASDIPDLSGTYATASNTMTFTNKSLTSSTNVLGGVTITLGGDAAGDLYYRNSSGVLTRLSIGSNGQFLNISGGLPTWITSSSAFSPHNLLSAIHSDAATASVIRGDIITGQGATPLWNRLAIGSQGQILQAGANEVGYTSYKLPTSVGTAGQQLRANGTDYVNKTTTTYQATPTDPSATTSTTGVMMGLAGSITPAYSGIVMITISGDIDNNGNNNGAQVQIRYGTGSAPANGAALTGTATGSLVKFFENNSSIRIPFHCNAIVTGLTVGTAYWIDISLASITGGTSRVRDISISVVEL